MDRTSMYNALRNIAAKVTMEETDKYYKKYSPLYPKLCTVRNVNEIQGAYEQMSSAIGITELYKRSESGPVQFQNLSEGYQIYAAKWSYDVGVEGTMELNKDLVQLKEFMTNWVKQKNLPAAVARTKEKIVANLFNYGGYTAGHAAFSQAASPVVPVTYGNLVYDGKPLFEPTGRSAKAHSTTYVNGLGALSLEYPNLTTADILLTSTNAKMENGEPFDNTRDNILHVPTALRQTGKKILESEYNPSNANNDVNPLRGEYDLVVNPYLSDTNAWFIGNKHGIVFWDTNDVDYNMWEIHETKQIRVSASIRIACAVVNWRSWVGANYATS